MFPPRSMDALLRANPVVGVEFVVPAGHSLLIRLALPPHATREPPLLSRVDVATNAAVAIMYSVVVRALYVYRRGRTGVHTPTRLQGSTEAPRITACYLANQPPCTRDTLRSEVCLSRCSASQHSCS
jgi:hypothetical protein